MITTMAITIVREGNRGENSEYCEEKTGKEEEKERNLYRSLVLPAFEWRKFMSFGVISLHCLVLT